MSQYDPNQQFPQGQYPHGPHPQHFAPQPPRKKSHKVRNALLISLSAFVALVGGCTALTASTSSPTNSADDAPNSQVTPAASSNTASSPQPTPTTSAPPQRSNPPSTTPPPATKKPTMKPKPIVYKKISSRQWKLIAKNPDAHIGEHIVIYGRVSQFDAATGTDAFRADVDSVVHRPSYGFVDYPTNTVMSGGTDDLSDLVEDDLFRAEVTVGGSLSYDTQIGGETTVPKLEVNSIKVTGSVAD